MRFWLVLLLTLSFSLQGWATARAASAPCPMEGSMAEFVPQVATGDDGSLVSIAAAVDDCCNDMATFLRTGKACKTGQDCPSPAVALTVAPLGGTLASQVIPAALNVSSLPPILVAVWRPPTSI